MSYPLKLLGIDTSTDACSAALYINGSISTRYEQVPKSHTRLLLPMVDSLLQENKLTLCDLDALAFGQGPGSFTGLRIACSVVQALAFGASKPVVPVSTLRAQAQRAYREVGAQKVFASLDARMQQMYWSLFELEHQSKLMRSIRPESVDPIESIQIAFDVWYKATALPDAADIVLIAAHEYQSGSKILAEEAFPVYLRNEIAKKP